MDKIRSILSSASGNSKKQGPPVPPRPPKTAVQKALEKTRTFNLPPPSSQSAALNGAPIAKGRTVIYTSNECFDTKLHESSSSPSTGLKVISSTTQNGNVARANKMMNKEPITATPPPPPVTHYKSPVPRPRLKTPPSTLPNLPLTSPALRKTSRDDELKEKLLNEIFSGRCLVEASNVHLRFNGNNLKRSSSCDVLNDRNSIIEKSPLTSTTATRRQHQEKSNDRKVEFHEILISELSEMRRENHRLSAAKSCSDLSPNAVSGGGGHKQVFTIINDSTNNHLVSLEDSGVEDEEKLDDCSSSGVGDSWDSCKEMQNRINMSLPGLPPLPKSLSGLELSSQPNQQNISKKISMTAPNNNKNTTLDSQLAILRREMYSLRQLDLSLLSQLYALNESIQEFRTMMQEQNENFSQQSPSPSNSDLNSLASDDENCDDMTIMNRSQISHNQKPPKNNNNNNVKSSNVKRMNILPPAPPLTSNC